MPPEDDELLFRAFGVKAKSVNVEARTVDVICSTDCIDSYGDIVEQSWDLSRYKANPVVLYAHDSRDLPIGRGNNMRLGKTDDGRPALECTIKFATEKANPMAEQVLQLFAEDVLRAVSVGFRPRSVRREMRDDREVYVLSDNVLHELSVTPVPANPEALAKHLARRTDQPRAERAMEITMLTQKDFDDLKSSHAAEIEKQKALVTDAEKRAVEATEARAKAEADLLELEAKVALLEGDVSNAAKAEKAAQDKLTEKEVDDLVGVKILPAERDEYVDLAKSDRPRFERMVKARPALKLTGKQLPKEPGPQTNTVAEDAADQDGSGLAKAARTRAARGRTTSAA